MHEVRLLRQGSSELYANGKNAKERSVLRWGADECHVRGLSDTKLLRQWRSRVAGRHGASRWGLTFELTGALRPPKAAVAIRVQRRVSRLRHCFGLEDSGTKVACAGAPVCGA